MSGRAVDSADLAALPVARNSFRASSVPALPRCRPAGCPKCISGVQYACPAPLPPGQSPEMYFGRPVCLPRPAAARSVARNSFRTSSMPAPPPCRLVSCPKFISGAWCACPAPLPPGQLPEIHFGRPVCLLRSAAAWSVARNSFRASSVPALPPCRLVCLPRPAAAWSVARNSFRASSVPAPPRCVSCPKFISGVQCACPAPLRQSPEIHCGRPVCLPRPAASVARNSLRASSMPAPPPCRLPEIHCGRPVCLPRPAASVARNSLRASSVPAPPRCVSRPKFIAGVQCACPAPLPPGQLPEMYFGRLVCLPRPATAWSVARNSFRASSVPAPPRCRLVSYPKCISGAWCACPAPLPPGQLPEMYFGRLVCLPRSAVATYNLYAPSARRNLSELVTTKTELHAIAAAASMGLSCHPVSG
jgi:hypothetical protein